jgi:preprotein translocase subunit SecA
MVQVLNTQRDRIYAERRKALLAPDLSDVMVEYATETMNDILEVRIEADCRGCFSGFCC